MAQFSWRQLSLINGQTGLVELQDDQVQRGRINGSHVALFPHCQLGVAHVEDLRFAQESAADGLGIGLPLVWAFTVLHLSIVEVGVMPMAEAIATVQFKVFLAILHHFGDIDVVILAGVVEASDRRSGDGGPAAAPLDTVMDTAVVFVRTLMDVVDRVVDNFLRYGDARVASGGLALYLGNRGGSLV